MRNPTKSAPKKGKENLGQARTDTQASHAEIAAADQPGHDTHPQPVGGGSHKEHLGQGFHDIHQGNAEMAAAGQLAGDTHMPNAGGGPHHQLCDDIRSKCRWRRFWMKTQHKLDRALESQIRRTETNWSPELSEAERAKANKEALAIIARARKGEGNPENIEAVLALDEARKPADRQETKYKKEAERLAMQLPIYGWIESIPGAGAGGLATIIGETGSLSLYSSCAKVWKRLGYAPYDGFAGSTWKRDSWRPRNLTSEEWIENPFSGARYALMYSIADSMLRKQKEGRDKELEEQQKNGLIPKDACLYRSGQKYGEPKGSFGEVYVRRRLHTDVTHPEWTPGHSHSDALRVMMKSFLKKLWREWNRVERETPEQTTFRMAEKPRDAVSAMGAGQAHRRLTETSKDRVPAPPTPEQTNFRVAEKSTSRVSAAGAGQAKSGLAEKPKSAVPVPQLSPERTTCGVAEKPESHLSETGAGRAREPVSGKTSRQVPVPQLSPEQTAPTLAEKPNGRLSANGSGAGQPGVSEKTMGAPPVPQNSPEQTIGVVAEEPKANVSVGDGRAATPVSEKTTILLPAHEIPEADHHRRG